MNEGLLEQAETAIGGEFERILTDIQACAESWEDNACLIGNVTAGQISRLCKSVAAKDKRIAELEAQLPKVVVPVYNCGDYVCKCGWTVNDDDTRINFNYCAGCGAKLDWTEVEK